jgi:hypothetical protein
MTRLLKPATLIPAIAGLLLGIVLDVVKDYITASGGVVLTVFVVLAALFGLGALWVQSRPHPAQAIMRSPVTLRTPVDRRTHARRGLIVFVSLYRPMGKDGSQLPPDEWVKAAQAGDYTALDLPHSNLFPAITSITSHQHRLEHCWLIATAGNSQQPGSVTYAPVLARYLQEEAGLTDCHFYGAESDSLAVSLDDDALVASKTRDLVNRIFRQAEQLGLQDREIAADFTGCPRSMALGMFLACLDRNRDIQFVGTHYDDQGRPTGDLFPVLFAFEPEMITE